MSQAANERQSVSIDDGEAQEPQERTEAEPAQQLEGEEVDGQVMPEDGPHPELKGAVDDQLGASADLVVVDPSDRQEAAVAMAAHDVERLLRDLSIEVQGNALKKWVYELPEGVSGLTVDAVSDITQRMAWRGYAKIRMLPEQLEVHVELMDRGCGDERYYVATVFAEDTMTGMIHSGTASEPQLLKVKPAQAKRKREKGQHVDEHDRLLDIFARAKAVNKAKRNAFNEFIPTEVEQAVIAMAKGNAALVERIQTEGEQRVQDLPAPLDTPEALELEKQCMAAYQEIRELAGGRGKIALPPGAYNGRMQNARHSLEAMQAVKLWLEERKVKIVEHYEKVDQQAAAAAQAKREERRQGKGQGGV